LHTRYGGAEAMVSADGKKRSVRPIFNRAVC
jgi:hypothetical protein